MKEIIEWEITPNALTPIPSEQSENFSTPDFVFEPEYKTEETQMVKISKINDGIYLGDKFLSQNPNFMIPYKISHIINVSGEKFNFKNEDISYQILNITWEESPNQVLLDKEDSISSEIQNFIDDCVETGEGLLIYSIKGQDRVCVIVLIYFMRKYNWSLQKGIDFLKVVKPDMHIPQFFINQLENYGIKLSNNKNKEKSDKWINAVLKDNYEAIITNTFINGYLIKTLPVKMCNNFHNKNLHVGWADNNPYNYETFLTCYNFQNDLYYKKDVEDIISHKKFKPIKSCIKRYMTSNYKVKKITEPLSTNKNIERENNAQFNINNEIVLNTSIKKEIKIIKKSNDAGQTTKPVYNTHSLNYDNLVKNSNSTIIEKNNNISDKNINNKKINKANRIKGANRILSIKKQTNNDSEFNTITKCLIKNDMNNKIILNPNNKNVVNQQITQNNKINNNSSILSSYNAKIIKNNDKPITNINVNINEDNNLNSYNTNKNKNIDLNINKNIGFFNNALNNMKNNSNNNIKNDDIIKTNNLIQQSVNNKINVNGAGDSNQNYNITLMNNNNSKNLKNNNLKKLKRQKSQPLPNQIIININKEIINNNIQNKTIQYNRIKDENLQTPKTITTKKEISLHQPLAISQTLQIESQNYFRRLQIIPIRPRSPQPNQRISSLQPNITNSSQIIQSNLIPKISINANNNNSLQSHMILNINDSYQFNQRFKEDASAAMKSHYRQTRNNDILGNYNGRQTWNTISSKFNNKFSKNLENFAINNYIMSEQSIIVNKIQNETKNVNQNSKSFIAKKIPHDRNKLKNYQFNNFNINNSIDKGFFYYNTMKISQMKTRLIDNWMDTYDNNNTTYYNLINNTTNEDSNYRLDQREKRPSAPPRNESSLYRNWNYCSFTGFSDINFESGILKKKIASSNNLIKL